jgi:23S rRNA (guanosine2251-2'-O)-methyltransferase
MIKIAVIAHNIRSTHNIGSIFRTCDGLGVDNLYLTGYTPYPEEDNDERLPHIAQKLNRQINKTALGAEKSIKWQHFQKPKDAINILVKQGYSVYALEQTKDSILLNDFKPNAKTAIILGEEVNGVDSEILKLCKASIEIPMLGKKESFNVSIAAAIALYAIRF